MQDDWPPEGYEDDVREEEPSYGFSRAPGYVDMLDREKAESLNRSGFSRELPRTMTRAEVGRFNRDNAEIDRMEKAAHEQATGEYETKDIIAMQRAGIVSREEARRLLGLGPSPEEARRLAQAAQERRHVHPMQRYDPGRYKAPRRGLRIRLLEATR